MSFQKTPKQIKAINKIAGNRTTLLEGGSRSGKTFIIIYAMIVRALKYPGTWHIVTRLRRVTAKKHLWKKTIPDVLKAKGIKIPEKDKNETDLEIEFPNGSKLIVDGLDDKERVEKILGGEYSTIFINEASRVSYDTYEILTTRLNPPPGIPPKFLLDYNPPSQTHWGYKVFHGRKLPDGRPVDKDDYANLAMNPIDNKENLSEDYIKSLNNLTGNKRLRFRDGIYTTEEGALWKRPWIKYKQSPETLVKVVIGVDPSGSKSGDEVGIIGAGKSSNDNIYILGDYSLNGSPAEWSDEVARAYSELMADIVAAEKNFGGDMVESVITNTGKKNINVKLVNASRGKAVRAEPVSALYEKEKVFHCEQFVSLESELCTWKPEDNKSPNRLDALVWAITELMPEKTDEGYAGTNDESWDVSP